MYIVHKLYYLTMCRLVPLGECMPMCGAARERSFRPSLLLISFRDFCYDDSKIAPSRNQ